MSYLFLASHDQDIEKMEELHKSSRQYYSDLKTADRDLKSAQLELEKLNQEKDFIQAELSDLQKKKAQIDLILNSSKATSSADAQKRKAYVEELKKLRSDIEASKKKLDKIQPDFLKAQQEESAQSEK